MTISSTPDSALHAYSPPFSPRETRYRCDICGVGVCSVTYRQMRTAVWGGTLTRSPVQDGEDGAYRIAMWEQISPVLHYNYGARTLDVRDGLSKYRGDPPEGIGAPGSRAHLAGGGDMEETEKAGTSEGDGELETKGETQRVEGACFCGQISYTFPADAVVRSAYCHCTQCQKLSGKNSDIATHECSLYTSHRACQVVRSSTRSTSLLPPSSSPCCHPMQPLHKRRSLSPNWTPRLFRALSAYTIPRGNRTNRVCAVPSAEHVLDRLTVARERRLSGVSDSITVSFP